MLNIQSLHWLQSIWRVAVFFILTAALGNSHLSESEGNISPRREVLSVIPLSKTPRAAALQKIMPIMFDISHQPLAGKPQENSCEVLIYLFQLFINYFLLSQLCHFIEHSTLPQSPMDILWCEALTDTLRLQYVLSAAGIMFPTNFQLSEFNKTYYQWMTSVAFNRLSKTFSTQLSVKEKSVQYIYNFCLWR